MKILVLSRGGFSQPAKNALGAFKNQIHYSLCDSFPACMRQALALSPEYTLFIDNLIQCDSALVSLLQRILEASPKVDGITVNGNGLASVYCNPPAERNLQQAPWSATPIAALPSWLAMIRMASVTDDSDWQTPEFFLLNWCVNKRVVRTLVPNVDFDTIAWAGDLLATSAHGLADDYARTNCTLPPEMVPPQLRVKMPGRITRKQGRCALQEPSFSVICPTIRPDFLKEAIDSVIAQTFPNWELRIGIDGPKESALRHITSILSPYASDRRIHIRQFRHSGTGPIRRYLSEQSRGDYIVSLDDDDRLTPDALATFAEAIRAEPDIAILRGGLRVFGLLEAYVPPQPRFTVDGITNDIFEVNQPYAIRRQVLEATGGFEWDPDLKNAGEDSDFFMKADRHHLCVSIINKPLYERRLSHLNQTLDCSAEECRRHVHNLYAKHSSNGWRLADFFGTGSGPYIEMRSVHRREQELGEIVCATRFLNFQQVGQREGVVLDLELTSLCNAVCTFCPREHLTRTARFLSLDLVERLALDLAGEKNTPTVVLCGIGESTLHPDLDKIIVILARGARVCMTTNAHSMTPERLDLLYDAGLAELNVSLNAATPETHLRMMRLRNFGAIRSACEEVANQRDRRWPLLEFHVSFVVTESNEAEVDLFVSHWRRPGVSKIWLHPLTNRMGLTAAECRPGDTTLLSQKYAGDPLVCVDLFPERRSLPNMCRIANGIDFISVDGEMLLCAQDYQARHRFGSISHQSLNSLREHKLLRHLRGETSKTCSGCTFCPSAFKRGTNDTYTIVQAGYS